MAREKGIRVAARGSGAGSLICHLLGISGVDPIEHGLLMERFCSPLRRALPDIDIDVESARRLEIYDATFARYGAPSFTVPSAISRCATVAMVETYRARHAIRDAGAALGLPAVEIDLLAKSMPHIRAANIEAALASLPELKSLNTSAPLMAMTIAMAQRLDGLPRHLAMHPCAIALSDATLLDRTPLQISAGGYPMLEFDKDDVEDIGLLKLDVLGVRMQSAIAHAVEEIRRTADPEFDIDAVPLDDPATYQLIQSTQTLGLFQIESPGQRELVGKLQPRTFNDLVIDISLFRPGPVKSDMIRPFLEARGGFTAPQLIHPTLAPILAETEGVVVFHEQVISIISVMTGISLAAGDEKRRALGSKEGQQEVCDWFFPAANENGYELSTITTVWEILRAFASFGFCKAHAAAFALPTYQSAWL
jgi:error-prone DNA polymerase